MITLLVGLHVYTNKFQIYREKKEKKGKKRRKKKT